MAGRRITILDDHAEYVEVLTEVLSDAGYEVTPLVVSNATLEELVRSRPDLIVLDLLLPGDRSQLTGWEYLRLIRSHAAVRGTPILICSADIVTLRARQAELAAEHRLTALEKPFELDALEAAVADLLGARRAPTWDDVTDFVLVADETGRLIDASAFALRNLGLRMDELRERRVADIVAHSEEWTESEWQRYQLAGRWDGRVTLKHRGGYELAAWAFAEIVRDAHRDWHISRLTLDGDEKRSGLEQPEPRMEQTPALAKVQRDE